MSRQLELALVSMLPTYGQDLPPQLIELAGSLLALSRSKASTLKAEEEIARGYACANIACERLKITLDLPTIEPRPPIPPRIYKRLYTHLDNILPNAAGNRRASIRNRTPNSKADFADSPGSQSRPLPSRGTPTKAQSLAQFRSKDNTPTKKAEKNDEDNEREGLHPWLAPVIRFICSESDNKRIAPTVLAGVEIIACPGGRRTEDVWVNEHPTEMLMAIIHAVFMQLKLLTTDQADEEALVVPLRKEIMDLMNRARSEVVFLGMEEDGAWKGWSKVRVRDFEEAVVYSKEQKWLDSDWFRNIADVVSAGQAGTDPMDQDEADIGSGPGGRADTMFQDRYDFLSEARKADYRVWKSTQLDRISQMLAAGGAMDVDS